MHLHLYAMHMHLHFYVCNEFLCACRYNPNGEIRTNTACHPGSAKARDDFENIELLKASATAWTFIAIVRDNTTYPTRTSVITNLGSMSEEARVHQCLYNSSFIFDAIEFNYPVVISPISLIPRAMQTHELQEQYMRTVGTMKVRTGPLNSEIAKSSARVPIVKRDFDLRTTLLAAPLLFHTRNNASTRCPSDEPLQYSQDWLKVQDRKMKNEKCSFPYQCPSLGPERLIACRGEDLNVEDEVYGPAYAFGAEKGWPEFLFSLTDNDVLFRGDQLIHTSSMIDSSTKAFTLILPFFTPQYGLITLLEMRVDFGGTDAVKSTALVRHYPILDGSGRLIFVLIQVLVILNLPMLIYDGVHSLVTARKAHLAMIKEYKQAEEALNPPPLPDLSEMITPVVDLLTAGVMLAYVSWNIKIKYESAEQAARLAGALSEIEWVNPNVGMESKLDTYLASINEFRTLIDAQEQCETLANILLYVNLIRMVQCTNLHPRLSILTRTLSNTMEDLFHAFLLFIMLSLLMASMAAWRFGDTREEFRSIGIALGTEMQMMLSGEFPPDWQTEWELTVYTMVFFVLLMVTLSFLPHPLPLSLPLLLLRNGTTLQCVSDDPVLESQFCLGGGISKSSGPGDRPQSASCSRR